PILCPARDAAAPPRRDGRLSDRGRAGHAAAPGRSGLRALVRRAAERYGRAPPDHRRRSGSSRMIILGLTGSIGMGKSTTATMFREEGVPVHDSDEAVHRIYAGPAAPLIEAAFPGTVVDGVVDRQLLAQRVLGKPEELRRLE